MKNILTRGGVEFVAVFLGIILSLYVDERRNEQAIRNDLFSDYASIRNDLDKDIPYLSKLIKYWKEDVDDCKKIIQMLDDKNLYNYKKFINLKKGRDRDDGGSFYGTKTAYISATSSGRLSYFGNNALSNKIGNIYEHHYNRIDENGKLFDDFLVNRKIRLNLGVRAETAVIVKQNEEVVNSYKFYTNNSLECFLRQWILDKMEKALLDMIEVRELLSSEIKNLQK